MADPQPPTVRRYWTKTVNLYQTRSTLSPGDPDGMRLARPDREGWVLHALLAEGWSIRAITPVTGGPAFAVLQKPAVDAAGSDLPVAPGGYRDEPGISDYVIRAEERRPVLSAAAAALPAIPPSAPTTPLTAPPPTATSTPDTPALSVTAPARMPAVEVGLTLLDTGTPGGRPSLETPGAEAAHPDELSTSIPGPSPFLRPPPAPPPEPPPATDSNPALRLPAAPPSNSGPGPVHRAAFIPPPPPPTTTPASPPAAPPVPQPGIPPLGLKEKPAPRPPAERK